MTSRCISREGELPRYRKTSFYPAASAFPLGIRSYCILVHELVSMRLHPRLLLPTRHVQHRGANH